MTVQPLTPAQPGATAAKPLLTVDVARKAFGSPTPRVVLENISFSVAEGEVVALLGTSGAGKTTLLRMIAGLDTSFDGSVLLRGEPVRGSRAGAGLVFQDLRLLPWERVEANVAFSLPSDMPKEKAAERVRETLRMVGLEDFTRAWPRELSGGMEKRVALARALAGSPDLLLLDEPFGALDSFTRMNLQAELAGLQRSAELSVVLVTHDIDEAVFLADRIIVLGGAPNSVEAEFGVDLPPLRDRTSHAFETLRQAVLAHVLNFAHRR